jgi:hypothetical protein
MAIMNRLKTFVALLSAALIFAAPLSALGPTSRITDDEAREIGRKIWQNESSGKILVMWDDLCDCASLGISNWLWYQEGKPRQFDATFLDLVDYLDQNGAQVPGWMRGRPAAPWKDLAAFRADKGSARMAELNALLASTIALQARFSAMRLEAALPKMLDAAPENERADIRRQFERVAQSPGGFYPLVDYVNFKGEGTEPKERYPDAKLGRPQGWGLLQVLEGMRGEGSGPEAIDEFARSAKEALTRRVENAPEFADGRESPHIKDKKWLGVWLRRVDTYKTSTR